ncbi:MAG: Ig-like domain repeat protein, partial [Actinobacteria bacterium]|nr:Ig-like domain repeat protein [Actinomycetota bacterium]
EDLTEAIESNGNAYAIGAGFLVQGNAAKTVVKSFTAAGETTSFAAQPEATTVGFAAKLSYNTAGSADITVSAAGTEKPTGSVKLTIAGKSYTGALNSGKARIALGGLIAAGRYTAKVEYTSDNALEFQNSSITSTVSVAKATPAVALKLSKSKVKTSQKATGAVSVSIPGALKASAKGLKVTVYDGKKKVATATLNSSGKASVKLPKLKKGTHKIKVTVTSTSNTNEKTSSTKTLKVTK